MTDETDPRIAHTRRTVRRAALVELGEVGYGEFTIEGVAARSGVAKSTIYRHWEGKLPLIVDALETLNEQPSPAPGDGPVRARVAVLLRHLADAMRDPHLSATLPALAEASERDPAIARFHHAYNARRRATLVDVIATGVATGELAATVDPQLAALALAGAIVYCRLMTDQPFPAERMDELVEQVLGGEGLVAG